MIQDAHEIRESQNFRNVSATNLPGLKQNIVEESDDDVALGLQTMVNCTDEGTLVPGKDGTLIASPSGTLIELESEMGTMVINSDIDDQTMKRHDTDSSNGGKKYRPMFLDHFDKKEAEVKVICSLIELCMCVHCFSLGQWCF